MEDNVAHHCPLVPCKLIAIHRGKIPRPPQAFPRPPGGQYPLIAWQQHFCRLWMTSPGNSYFCPWRIGREAGCYWAESDGIAADVVVVVVVVVFPCSLAILFCIDSCNEPQAWHNWGIYRDFQASPYWHRGTWGHLHGAGVRSIVNKYYVAPHTSPKVALCECCCCYCCCCWCCWEAVCSWGCEVAGKQISACCQVKAWVQALSHSSFS